MVTKQLSQYYNSKEGIGNQTKVCFQVSLRHDNYSSLWLWLLHTFFCKNIVYKSLEPHILPTLNNIFIAENVSALKILLLCDFLAFFVVKNVPFEGRVKKSVTFVTLGAAPTNCHTRKKKSKNIKQWVIFGSLFGPIFWCKIFLHHTSEKK